MSDEHLPVLCEETIEAVIVRRGEDSAASDVYVDATFGRGGHARALLSRLGSTARLIAMDRDPAARQAAAELSAGDPRVSFQQARFSELERVLDAHGAERVSGVIMDLGVSSPQLDDPDRGFSFRADGPLDMRMDSGQGETAAEWLNRAPEQDIARVLRSLGEERHAGRIAAAIVRVRPLSGTRQLAQLVREVIGERDRHGSRSGRGSRTDPATRTFQAIRMHINQELEEAEAGIRAAFRRLETGGRLAVISFHSLEDQLVKRTFRELVAGKPLPRRMPVREASIGRTGRIAAGPVRASAAELAANPRARSATLRVLERIA